MNNHRPRPAVFIDRDGTINEDAGYLCHPDELNLYPWSAEAIRLLNDSGLRTFVVTNQSGVARGLCTEHDLQTIHDSLVERLGKEGARLDAIYYCPHHPEIGEPPHRQACECRKPGTGMIDRAMAEHAIDIGRSYVIGDKVVDLELAIRAGARPVLVLTGYGRITLERIERLDIKPAFICENLLDAAKCILQDSKP